MGTVSVRELRNHGEAVLDRVTQGAAVIVTRDGVEVAELRPRARGPSAAELIARRRNLPPIVPAGLRRGLDRVVNAAL